MKKKQSIKSSPIKAGDVSVAILCLAGIVACLYFFRLDINQTLSRLNEQPVGSVRIKNRSVRRRFENRVLWDQLQKYSPVYAGDLIRTDELANASLIIGDAIMDIDAASIIQISFDNTRRRESGGRFRFISPAQTGGILRIELLGGSASVNAGQDSVVLASGSNVLTVTESSVVSAFFVPEESDFSFQVNDGSAVIESTGEIVSAGEAIVIKNGAAVPSPFSVISPSRVSRILSSGVEKTPVTFVWTASSSVRIEAANDKAFTHVIAEAESDAGRESLFLPPGQWFWRVIDQEAVQFEGIMSIIAAPPPQLLSPADGETLYLGRSPTVSFTWFENGGKDAESAVSYYLLEVSDDPGMRNAALSGRIQSTGLANQVLDEGRWYWRVTPAYDRNFSGVSPVPSEICSFVIEKGSREASLPPVHEAKINEEKIDEKTGNASLSLELSEPMANKEVPVTPPAVRVLLSGAAGRQPPDGYVLGVEQLRTNRSMGFGWNKVPGATAYIFSLYQTNERRRLILQTGPLQNTSYVLSDLKVLQRGNFIWTVEAIRQGRQGSIEQRGRVVENRFTVNIPELRRNELPDVGELYGQ